MTAYSPGYRRILHKMEFYQYQDGLIRRYMEQNGAWDSHLQRCRDYILRAVEKISPAKVTILGSGWLLEVPLLELSERVNSVCLIDIIHPSEVVKQVSALKNVTLMEADISGGLIKQIWDLTRGSFLFRKKIDAGQITIPDFRLPGDPGLVISLNLLSQLDALPVKMLREKALIDGNGISEFRKKLQDQHIAILKIQRSVLISDYLEIFTTVSGETSEEKTVVAGLPAGSMEEEWTWDFDSGGTDFNRKRSVLKVKALII